MLRDFLSALWGDLTELHGELRFINGSVEQEWVSSVEEAVQASTQRDRGNTFFGVLPRTRREGTADATVDPKVLWADLDPKGRSRRETFRPLLTVEPRPSIIVDSGQGYHAYWLLKEPASKDKATKAMQYLATLLSSDPSVKDMARILRVPNTLNHKVEPPVPVRLLIFRPDDRYWIEDFGEHGYSATPSGVETPSVASHGFSGPIGEGGRNQALTSLAGAMRRRGLEEDAIYAALAVHNEKHCRPPLSEREVRTIAKSVTRSEPVSSGW